MDWLKPAVIATLVGSGVLAYAYWFLYHLERERFLRIWAVGWSVYALRFMFQIPMLYGAGSPLLAIGHQEAAFLSGMLLVLGTYAFIERPAPRALGILAAAGAAWIPAAEFSGWPFFIRTMPVFAFLGVALIWAGVRLMRAPGLAGIGTGLAGWAMVLWGVHKFNYPLLRPVEWFAPWGFLLGALLSLLTALGMIFIYFGKSRARLLSEAQERKRAEDALRENERKYRFLFDSSVVGISIVDREGRYLDANAAFESMLGYGRGELVGKSVREVSHPDEMEENIEYFRDALEGRCKYYRLRKRYLTRQGGILWGDLSVIPIFDDDGGFQYCIAMVADVTERKEAEERIEASLREKEVLLREIHHRVKNNMQIVSSLLNLQASKIKDAEMLRLFSESCNRIRSMALIHERLYRSRDFTSIDLERYLHDLVNALLHTFGGLAGAVRKEIHVEGTLTCIDTLIPFGLIVNELVSNSLKYAFSGTDGRDHELRIEFAVEGATRRLAVVDNGSGLPTGMDPLKSTTLGLQIVTALVDQLDGRIGFDTGPGGTRFSITFEEKTAALQPV